MTGGFGVRRSAPSGTIFIWGNPLSEIPAGWVLCDGNNGTPNLLGKFLRGAPSGTDPGATGGENSKTLTSSQLPSHGHSFDTSTSSDGSHSHSWSVPNFILGSSNSDADGLPYASDSYTRTSNSGGAHSHTVSSTSTGGGQSFDNQPEHMEVAYIMKT